MIDVLEAVEILLAARERHGARSEFRAQVCIRSEIRDAIVRSGSRTSADAVCEAIETGDVKLCRASGVTLGAVVVWSVALRSAAQSLDAVVSEACDAGVGYLFVLPETVYRNAGIDHESRQAVLLKLELEVRRALTESARLDCIDGIHPMRARQSVLAPVHHDSTSLAGGNTDSGSAPRPLARGASTSVLPDKRLRSKR
jgi:hypothetical protein